MILIQNTKSQT